VLSGKSCTGGQIPFDQSTQVLLWNFAEKRQHPKCTTMKKGQWPWIKGVRELLSFCHLGALEPFIFITVSSDLLFVLVPWLFFPSPFVCLFVFVFVSVDLAGLFQWCLSLMLLHGDHAVGKHTITSDGHGLVKRSLTSLLLSCLSVRLCWYHTHLLVSTNCWIIVLLFWTVPRSINFSKVWSN